MGWASQGNLRPPGTDFGFYSKFRLLRILVLHVVTLLFEALVGSVIVCFRLPAGRAPA